MSFLSDNLEGFAVNDNRQEDLARQSLGRALEDSELALAEALSDIFGTGQHDLAKVAEALQERGVARPSGESGVWSLSVLEEELAAINASLDAAHEQGGITRLA